MLLRRAGFTASAGLSCFRQLLSMHMCILLFLLFDFSFLDFPSVL